MADIANQQDFEAWLQNQPRKVVVTLVARGALRALPVVQMVNHATVVAWATAKYPAHEAKFAAAAKEDERLRRRE